MLRANNAHLNKTNEFKFYGTCYVEYTTSNNSTTSIRMPKFGVTTFNGAIQWQCKRYICYVWLWYRRWGQYSIYLLHLFYFILFISQAFTRTYKHKHNHKYTLFFITRCNLTLTVFPLNSYQLHATQYQNLLVSEIEKLWMEKNKWEKEWVCNKNQSRSAYSYCW